VAQFFRHFSGSLIFSAVCLALAAAYGWNDTGSVSAVGGMLWVVLVLAVLKCRCLSTMPWSMPPF
jgi:hypothetical protein